MDDWINVDAISITPVSCQAKLELDERIDDFGPNYKLGVLKQIHEQAETQLYDLLADLFIKSTSLENRKKFNLKNRVIKFAKEFQKISFVIPNISKLEKVCRDKLEKKTKSMFIWL